MTNIYGAPVMKKIQFRQKLARELMENTYLEINKGEERRKRKRDSGMVHKLLTIPRGMKFKGDHLVKSKIHYYWYYSSLFMSAAPSVFLIHYYSTVYS